MFVFSFHEFKCIAAWSIFVLCMCVCVCVCVCVLEQDSITYTNNCCVLILSKLAMSIYNTLVKFRMVRREREREIEREREREREPIVLK